jgi:hypothetical protein
LRIFAPPRILPHLAFFLSIGIFFYLYFSRTSSQSLTPGSINCQLNGLRELNNINSVRGENSQIKLTSLVLFEGLFDIIDVWDNNVDAW